MLNECKIKWNKFYILKDCTSYNEYVKFGLSPEDFLKFAKQDLKNLDNKGLVEGLSNSKRAIDCQVDWIISYLGFDYLNFNEQHYPYIKSMINEFEAETYFDKNLSFKLRFLQAMEITPIFLIAKIRKLRNELEHEYLMPQKDEVREAVEIAELFINATQNILWHKFISDYFVLNEYNEDYSNIKKPYIDVSINLISEEGVEINVLYKGEDKQEKIKILPENKEYIMFLKASISNNFEYLPKIFGCDIDTKYINYEIKEV
ncbi:hypothetical protein [Clostridium neonatale]|uniref:hypothetical protein n=1 Tax=Clostridium neonatale TaxID=137838 RepID=UPI00291BA95D|nr:conserved hypothetical protein [Clostridium neonatale]